MSARISISIFLVTLAIIIAAFPFSGKYSLKGQPQDILKQVLDPKSNYTPDQTARAIVMEDNKLQLIDLRKTAAYKKESLPGAINIPYETFLAANIETMLDKGKMQVLYSDNPYDVNYTLVLLRGLGYKNSFVMEGGLKAWYDVVMNSSFSGERLTARENSVFETRYKARKMFNELNEMPDSLKIKYRALKEIERKKLDGGCE